MMSICLGFGLFFIFVTEAAGLYCLSCTNSVSPRHCHTVRKCSKGEVCFTESHLSENGLVVFDTGCGSFQACHSNSNTSDSQKRQHGIDPHYQHSRCLECCSSDLCNNGGCGQKGYPSARGPVCFDCPQVSDPTLCDTIKVCDLNQECYVQEEEEFGDTFYTSSCISKHACTSNIEVFGKRKAEHCSKCCQLDLCNAKCDVLLSLPTTSSTTVKTTIQAVEQSKTTAVALSLSKGNRGTEFLVLFMQNYDRGNGSLMSYVTTNNASLLNILISPTQSQVIKSQVDQSLYFVSFKNILFPYDLACYNFTIEYKATLLRTSEPSSVTVFNAHYAISSNDGTLVIPIHKLSTKYIVPTMYELDSFSESQFAIGALYNDTHINIQFKLDTYGDITIKGNRFTSGDIFSITLERLETFQISQYGSLTGTLITSNNPIALFAGNLCQNVVTSLFCNHMISQLPPIDQFDNEFIIPAFYNNSRTDLQILSPVQNTMNMSSGYGTSTSHLTGLDPYYFEITSNKVELVKLDHPALVTVYARGSPSYNNPYMTVMPGINQYLDYYKIVVPDQYRDNYLCVIFPTQSVNNLLINRLPISQFNTVHQQIVVSSGKLFSVRTIRVQEGVFTLRTTDQEPFGLIVYGHKQYGGYGFAGNFVLP